MDSLKLSLSLSSLHRRHFIPPTQQPCSLFPNKTTNSSKDYSRRQQHKSKIDTDNSFSTRYRFSASSEEEKVPSFDEAVDLFNKREYYECHDFLEAIWNGAEEPSRTLIHGVLQCAVGFHHLFNHNHRGAMMELGEGLCKLRKMDFRSGPFHQFERDISQVLDFVYQTQIELAACGEDLCVAMDGSERSYQLLGGYGSGQHVYELQSHECNDEAMYILFCPQTSYQDGDPPRVKLPTLNATAELLEAF